VELFAYCGLSLCIKVPPLFLEMSVVEFTIYDTKRFLSTIPVC
jgi:hypothetical protein